MKLQTRSDVVVVVQDIVVTVAGEVSSEVVMYVLTDEVVDTIRLQLQTVVVTVVEVEVVVVEVVDAETVGRAGLSRQMLGRVFQQVEVVIGVSTAGVVSFVPKGAEMDEVAVVE